MAEDTEIMSIFGYAILFVVVAVAISLGASVLKDIQDTQPDLSASHANETLDWAGNNTPHNLLEFRIITSSIKLYNNGSIVKIGSGDNANYSVTSSSITIINGSHGPVGINGADWITDKLNVSYNYLYGSAAKNVTEYGLSTQNTLAKWLPTIALVLIIAVIIGVLIVYLARRYT